MFPAIHKEVHEDLTAIKQIRGLLAHKTTTSKKLEEREWAQNFGHQDLKTNQCLLTCYRRLQEFKFSVDYVDFMCATHINVGNYATAIDDELEKLESKIHHLSNINSNNPKINFLKFTQFKLKKALESSYFFFC